MELYKNEMPETERRRFPRLDASVGIEYSILGKAPLKETAFTKNISAGGICLIVYEKIEVNTILSLRINLCDNSDIIGINLVLIRANSVIQRIRRIVLWVIEIKSPYILALANNRIIMNRASISPFHSD